MFVLFSCAYLSWFLDDGLGLEFLFAELARCWVKVVLTWNRENQTIERGPSDSTGLICLTSHQRKTSTHLLKNIKNELISKSSIFVGFLPINSEEINLMEGKSNSCKRHRWLISTLVVILKSTPNFLNFRIIFDFAYVVCRSQTKCLNALHKSVIFFTCS